MLLLSVIEEAAPSGGPQAFPAAAHFSPGPSFLCSAVLRRPGACLGIHGPSSFRAVRNGGLISHFLSLGLETEPREDRDLAGVRRLFGQFQSWGPSWESCVLDKQVTVAGCQLPEQTCWQPRSKDRPQRRGRMACPPARERPRGLSGRPLGQVLEPH